MTLDEAYQARKAGEITNLKYYLIEKNITVAELSRRAQINKRTLDDYVSGRREIADIGFGKALRICDVLGVDPYYLI